MTASARARPAPAAYAAPHAAPHAIRGMFLVLGAVLLFVAMDTASKYLVRFYPVPTILSIRFVVHTLLFAAVVLPRFGVAAIRTQRIPVHLLRGLLLVGSSFFFAMGVRYLPLAETSAISYLAPVLVMVLAVVFLKERVEPGLWVAIACSFAGVLLIIRPGSDVFSWAALLPLTTAFLFATYQVLTRRLSGIETPLAMIFYPGLVGALIFAFSWAVPGPVPSDPWHLLLLAASGALSLSGHLTLIKAYQCAPASRLAPFGYTQLIWVTLSGYLFFGNFPDALSLAGIGILVASGVYCATHQRQAGKGARREMLEAPTGD